jgi:hypothetical protein
MEYKTEMIEHGFRSKYSQFFSQGDYICRAMVVPGRVRTSNANGMHA